jgi:aspartyl-tRNA(Asn)/glutamyl-tRNA(Gln) amidotransferase subunit C
MPSDPQPPRFDADLVKHIAYLVRLGISEDEAQAFGRQFETIIDYFNLLNEADLSQVEPARQALQPSNILREDLAQPSLPRSDFLANVPEHDDDYVKVPAVTGVE